MHSRRFKDACSSRVPLARQVQIGGGEYLIDTILCIFGGGQAWQEQEKRQAIPDPCFEFDHEVEDGKDSG